MQVILPGFDSWNLQKYLKIYSNIFKQLSYSLKISCLQNNVNVTFCSKGLQYLVSSWKSLSRDVVIVKVSQKCPNTPNHRCWQDKNTWTTVVRFNYHKNSVRFIIYYRWYICVVLKFIIHKIVKCTYLPAKQTLQNTHLHIHVNITCTLYKGQ